MNKKIGLWTCLFGLIAIVVGVMLISVPAGIIVGGAAATFMGYALAEG